VAATWTWKTGDAVVAGDILCVGFAAGQVAAARRGAVRVRWQDGSEEQIDDRAAARRGLRKPN
jgi:hypothetical protein